MKVILNEEQKALREQIEKHVETIRSYINMDILGRKKSGIDITKEHRLMAKAAHILHMSLDPKPKHHRYMIVNRGVEPEDIEFYNHIHPVEDLLDYLDDTAANDDPDDKTLGEKFNFKVYTRRWGHYDTYTLTRNEKGWHVSFGPHNDQGGRNAEPILSYILRHDSVAYPHNISFLLEEIWERAQEEGLEKEDVQSLLNDVAEWISNTEKKFPNHILYR
ncbi:MULTISPECIES: hypothetical protein [Bacillus subtilis group]|uniref:hypothetical protein n=1 Tax=Bacillus subtilis group TaxID=653685 RepID=UPI000948AAB2|nr:MULTISPECIES: hypothetical protein [Bacillus subtilis group]MEC2046664.1 hypothetical protein [Bacillus licheniformis]MED1634046.1 hypothetical protein [Bacillus licheniformis]OKS84187.1 hypothetical protein BFN05_01390 [Bacillus licheniformis]QGI41798.1 hypothetical protein GII88_01165 [Bacillus licheniformis]RWZ56858.1 hypothetical protein EQJ38_08030 [Bacillus licheniformis]